MVESYYINIHIIGYPITIQRLSLKCAYVHYSFKLLILNILYANHKNVTHFLISEEKMPVWGKKIKACEFESSSADQ